MKFTSIWISNLLSFGRQTKLDLSDLNVLVGPNGSGKSNLIEVINLIRCATTDYRNALRKSGSHTWQNNLSRQDDLEKRDYLGGFISSCLVDDVPFRHRTEFGNLNNGYWIAREVVESERIRHNNKKGGEETLLAQEDWTLLKPLEAFYNSIRIFREWQFGVNAIYRSAQSADQRNDRLAEDFSNLGLILSKYRKHTETKRGIVEELKNLNPSIEDYEIIAEAGSVQIFLVENGKAVPASRLSDGTLRYLCLLTILCDPDPRGPVCIEEPELGLHPDLIPEVARLIVGASKKRQVIITTHSDILVDALSNMPESIIVCEKEDGCTTFRRLESKEVEPWLEDSGLGQVWLQGHIGGKRW
jgi:predicted ATPase